MISPFGFEISGPLDRARSCCSFSKLIKNLFTYCVASENIDTHPMEAQWKYQGVGGFQKSIFWNESVILKGNFRRVG